MAPTSTASCAAPLPRAAAFRVALMHSLWSSSEEAILKCICVVGMCPTSCGGRERLHVMFVCQVRVVGSVGCARNGLESIVVLPVLVVYKNVEGKGF